MIGEDPYNNSIQCIFYLVAYMFMINLFLYHFQLL